jgi:hypothetical protein
MGEEFGDGESTLGPRAFMFEAMKDRIRESLFGCKDAALLDLFASVEFKPGFALHSEVVAVLRGPNLQLEVSDEEEELIHSRFANHRHEMDYRRFYNAMEMDAPPDFADPEIEIFDTLPQPYRMIVKVLEIDIIDRAWDEIVLKEEAQRGPGAGWRPGRAAASAFQAKGLNVGKICMPSVPLDGLGFITTFSSDFEATRCLVGNAAGTLHLIDAMSGGDAPLESLEVFPTSVGGVRCMSNVSGRAEEVDAAGAEIPSTVAVAGHSPPPTLDADGQPVVALDDDGQPIAVPAGVVHVYEYWASKPHIELRCIIHMDKPVAQLTVSEDTKYIAVTTFDAGVEVIQLPDRNKRAEVADSEAEKPSEPAEPPAEDDTPKEPLVLTSQEGYKPALTIAGVAVKKEEPDIEVIEKSPSKGKLPPKEAVDEPEPVQKEEPPPPKIPTVYFLKMVVQGAITQSDISLNSIVTSGVIVCQIGEPTFEKYALGPGKKYELQPVVAKKNEPEEPPPTGKGGKPKTPAKGAKGAPAVEEPVEAASTTSAKPTNRWTLPAAISCSEIDTTGSLLALGLQDGTVIVWDTHAGVEYCITGRHRANVTCVGIHRQQYVVSGSEDKLLYVYDISSTGAHNAAHVFSAKVEPRLVALINDFGTQVLNVNCFSDVPIAVVIDANSCCRVYDLEHGSFLGDIGICNDGSWVPFRTEGAQNLQIKDVGEEAPPAPEAGDVEATQASDFDETVEPAPRPLGTIPIFSRGDQIAMLAIDDDAQERVQQLWHNADWVPPPTPEAEPEAAEPDPDVPPAPELVPWEPLPQSRLVLFFTWDVIKKFCPGIAAACGGQDHSHTLAKHLFMTKSPEERVDPHANLSGLAQQGTFEKVNSALNRGKMSQASISPTAMLGQSTSKGVLKRAGTASSNSKKNVKIPADASPQPSVVFGLSAEMLGEPAKVRLARAPVYVNPRQRAKLAMLQQMDAREDRDARLRRRRQDILNALVPELS